ncbi:11194_t:CDS:2 [Diversispora eburnea]|uniref:11194_t:CDS:1 n=1 Tax=Diversispora eburnea TaxID=1213867 RepID=A0A9N9ATE8_9GLOM|nr:11194_t:CDS:2 [Diversispora eburnea]
MPFESFQKTCKNLRSFYEKGKFYDVQIIIENHPPNAKTFYAHKFFLCSQSPYFERQLIPDDDDINDKEENVTNLLVIKDISTEVFEVLFHSTIEFNDKSGLELFEILLGANKLKIEVLVHGIQSHLIEYQNEYLCKNFAMIYHPKTLDSNDFKFLTSILKNYIPLIRFIQFSSEQFKSMVRPYKKILPTELYEELIEYFLTPGIKLNSINTIPPPRHGLIDSTIITSKHAAFIASWVDRKDKQNIYFYPYECDENPYDFKLLLRGSRDNFSSTVFHEMCDNKTNTVW